jgi:hypothetical protein
MAGMHHANAKLTAIKTATLRSLLFISLLPPYIHFEVRYLILLNRAL